MNLSQVLSFHARYRPDKLAVVFKDTRLSYQEFNDSCNRLANALQVAGIKKGDKVASFLPNSLELLEIYWATAKIGAVVVPFSPLVRGQGLVNLISDSESLIIVSDAAGSEHLDKIKDKLNKNMLYWLTGNTAKTGYQSYFEQTSKAPSNEPKIVEIADDDPYNIIYSSGTTGLPKGIVLSHNTRANYCTMCANFFRVHIDSVVLQTGSIVFNGAFLTLMPAFYLGATYILEPSFNPKTLVELAKQERVTHMMLVPSQIIAMLEQKQFKLPELKSVEMILTVGAPLHQIYKDELDKRLPKVFYELYGLTEGFFTVLDNSDFKRKPNSVGCPTQFSTMRIVDDAGKDLKQGEIGEIIGKSPFLMTHYYKDPKQTAEAIKDGWLYSGDLGYTDEEGFLYLADRKKDMIISGGINVYPNDIEAIVSQHESVVEVAVFGVADPEWGETPVAAVILRSNDINEEELKEWVNERLEARYQKLSKVIFMDNFPRSSAGKTLKRELRETFKTN